MMEVFYPLHICNIIPHTIYEVKPMLTMIISVLFFLLFVALAQLLMILNSAAYILVIIYLIDLCIAQFFYKQINYRSLEWKDFFIVLSIILSFILYYDVANQYFDSTMFCYLYVSVFISFEMFVNSLRFKSLM